MIHAGFQVLLAMLSFSLIKTSLDTLSAADPTALAALITCCIDPSIVSPLIRACASLLMLVLDRLTQHIRL